MFADPWNATLEDFRRENLLPTFVLRLETMVGACFSSCVGATRSLVGIGIGEDASACAKLGMGAGRGGEERGGR